MSIEILTDRDTNKSVMLCNTSDIAFGPVFGEDEDPREFLDWYSKTLMGKKFFKDVRMLSPKSFADAFTAWRKQVEENEAEVSGERHFTEPGAWSGGFARNN